MKKELHHYGGWYIGFFKSKWFTIWFSDYRKNRFVPVNFQIEFYSKLWGNKTFSIGKHSTGA